MAFITVDKAGENQIIVVPGANETAIDEVGDHQGVLLAQLELPLATVSSFFRRRRNPSLTILNAAPFQAEAQPLFGLADVVVINETELAAYLGFPEPPANAEAIASNARTLLSRDGQHIVITLGERGSVTVGEDRTLVAAAPPAKVVDTTGAGDCFCGYLAAGLGAGLNLEAAIHTAHYAATLAVSAPGASSSIPSMLDVTILPADLSGELDPVSAFDPKQTLTALLRFFRQ
jgi:ribokinase